MRKDLTKQRIVYWIAKMYEFINTILPLRIRLVMGKYLGLLFYYCDFSHRRIVKRNLLFAFGPSKNPRELNTIARNNFIQFGMILTEWVGLPTLSKEKLYSLVTVEGKEHLLEAKKKNRSVILLSGHFGNWEYAHHTYASSINRLSFIVRAIDNIFVEKERTAFNQRFGVSILYKKDGLRNALKKLKNGEDLVLFFDRKANKLEGIPCQFFGKKTSTLPIVSALAQKYNLPVVPMFLIRSADPARHRLIFLPELNLNRDGTEKALYENTQLQNDTLEKIIKQYPDHWLWAHRKWKCYHPGIYK